MLQAQHVDRDAALELELGAEALEEVVEAVGSHAPPRPPSPLPGADPGRPDPRQVVQPDVLDRDVVGIDAEIVPDPSLGPDGHVAQADGAVALVEQRLRHDPDRVGEVDQPGARIGPGRHLLGQLEHDRHRAQRLGQPAGARRSPGPGTRSPTGSVSSTWRAAWPPMRSWTTTKSAPSERGVRVGRRRERAAPSPRPQDALGESTHDLAPQVARIEQDEIVDDDPVLQIAQTVDQFGGVGAPTADDGHLGPHAAQRNIRPCPRPLRSSRRCWRSTGAARRRTSSSSRAGRRSRPGPGRPEQPPARSASTARSRRCARRSPRSLPDADCSRRARAALPDRRLLPGRHRPARRRGEVRAAIDAKGWTDGSSCATTRSPSRAAGRRPPGASASSAARA